MSVVAEVKELIEEVLQLKGRGADLSHDSALLGAIPEFDSMAVVALLTAIEERFDVIVEDDEITGETFATLGSLVGYVESKLEAA